MYHRAILEYDGVFRQYAYPKTSSGMQMECDNNICWKKRHPLSNGRKDPTVGGKALIKIRKDNSTIGSSTCKKRKKKNQSTLKRHPLSNGRKDPTVGGKALIKIRKDNSTIGSSTCKKRKKKNQSTLVISGSVLLASSIFMNLIALLCVFKIKGKKPKKIAVVPGVNLRSFSYNELEEATNGFKEELGTGAFSTVYKAVLEDEKGKVVAVKKLNKMVAEGEEGFEAEVNSISRTNHKNLIAGLASPKGYKLLLTLPKDFSICMKSAAPKLYIVTSNPQNVLLDESLTAKLADFGMAKLLRKNQTRTTTRIRGTRGYVAPEWFRNVPINVKVDVYSFGVLLLELICCRKIYEQEVENENEIILVEWAFDCYKRNELHLLVGDDEEELLDIKSFEKFLMVAIWCIQQIPALRPSMKKVILMLEGSIEVSIPIDPFSFTNFV
ncbi:G-type lectin S-receptor-like serine/threonine-protein kinase LECRK4 [Lycium barbarum]|uniref:G-type lectin S-receptor-like serine/threonine-protein kinase LECRK4 n=1 Tax=Lycium barbarum TaxID=112863 RepID=UPI00293EC546|nr:G-type lectin S-receptor-like serine/threonine-protein kinase LECRK4 [Lycium barbarum]